MENLDIRIQKILEKAKLTKLEVIKKHAEKDVPIVIYNPTECKLGEVILEWADGRRLITNQKPILHGNQHCF
jgi:hypothetical protein